MNKIKIAIVFMAVVVSATGCSTKRATPTVTKELEGVSRPIVKGRLALAKDSGRTYRRAEKLFAKRAYEKAANTYLSFIVKTPAANRLIDNAYFKTGLSWFELGRFRDALYYFNTVVARYPDSEVYVEALINMAICHYYLKSYEKAEDRFAEATPLIARSGHKAYIYFYRAQIAEDLEKYEDAARLYVESERVAESEALIKTVRDRVEQIFHNFFQEEALILATNQFFGEWPSMIAFEELFNLYQRSGDRAGLAEAKRAYHDQFPPKSSIYRFYDGGDDTFEPDEPKIGAALPLTGYGATAGREIIQGIQLAFNAHHSLIEEKRLQLVVKDTGSRPEGAEAAIADLAEDKNTIAILGPAFSASFARAAPLAEQFLVPIFSPSATAELSGERGGHLFRNSLTTRAEANKMAELAMDSLGLSTFAVIYPDNPAGQEVFAFFRQAITEQGGMILAAEPYDLEQTDFSVQIKRIGGMTDNALRKIIIKLSEDHPDDTPPQLNATLEALRQDALTAPYIVSYGGLPLTNRNFRPGLAVKYDAVYVLGPYNKTGLIMPQLEFYNLTDIVRLAGRGANHPGFIKTAEKYAEGVMFVDGFYIDSHNLAIRYFVKQYRLAFRSEPSALAAQAYDAAQIILSAIGRGASTRREITRYLETLTDFDGVSGSTSMSESGDADKEVFYLTVAGKKIVEFAPIMRPGGLPDPEEPRYTDDPQDPLSPFLVGQ